MQPTSIDETLTRADREAPFVITRPDLDPLPALTRTATVWDGSRFTEHDPVTGRVVALGDVSQEARA